MLSLAEGGPVVASSDKATLREAVAKARHDQGWSLREVERKTGIHNAHLSQIESGTIERPDPNILYALADVYGLDYDLLLRLAGHVRVTNPTAQKSVYGAVAWRALSELSEDEKRDVVEFMTELKTRRNGETGDQ
jgi:transcriptional regulator with XRE-family HTH domain